MASQAGSWPRCALGGDDDEQKAPGGAFSGEDGPTIYEQRTRVDQVLAFFELEHDRFSPYVQDVNRLEQLRIEYYNCVNATEFQDELISQLVEELLDLRRNVREPGMDVAARKEICIQLANIRLDIGDRKTKRFFKEKDRKALLQTISPLITEAKVQRLLEEQANASREAEETSAHALTDASHMRTETQACTSGMEAHETNNVSRRRRKYYSDEELTALLQEKDH